MGCFKPVLEPRSENKYLHTRTSTCLWYIIKAIIQLASYGLLLRELLLVIATVSERDELLENDNMENVLSFV